MFRCQQAPRNCQIFKMISGECAEKGKSGTRRARINRMAGKTICLGSIGRIRFVIRKRSAKESVVEFRRSIFFARHCACNSGFDVWPCGRDRRPDAVPDRGVVPAISLSQLISTFASTTVLGTVISADVSLIRRIDRLQIVQAFRVRHCRLTRTGYSFASSKLAVVTDQQHAASFLRTFLPALFVPYPDGLVGSSAASAD